MERYSQRSIDPAGKAEETALMPTVYRRAAARRDLIEHFVYLAENAGLDVAERFLASAAASFNDLAGQPMIGAPLTLRRPELAGMRKWRINDFDNYLVFYLPPCRRRVHRTGAARSEGLVEFVGNRIVGSSVIET